jgi:2-C-methyl-D-erythritol 4-phosphate cytidylyltransferase
VSDTRIVVIVPAAGAGTRFGGDMPKQFRPLAGKPLVQRVVERFLYDVDVTRVVIPVAELLLSVVSGSNEDRVKFVGGGETRLQSVARGLEHVGDAEIVAVHDAVRPFFSIDTFHAAINAALEHGVALPVIPLVDTVHVVANDTIVSTPDRATLASAQTPQCFRIDILRDVIARALREGDDSATDEAGLAAKYGYTVKTVPGDSMNFKITRPEDLVMAERVMAEWGAEQEPVN